MGNKIFIPGVSEGDLELIQEKLGVSTIAELAKAAKAKRIRRVKGLSGKVELAILRGIKLLQEKPQFIPIGIAYGFSQAIIKEIEAWPLVSQVLLVGDLRRGREEVDKIEILIAGRVEGLEEKLLKLPGIESLLERNSDVLLLKTLLGIPLEIHFARRENWGKRCLITTGTKAHIQALEKINGLPDLSSEREIYKALDLPFICPEIRETGYEVDIAKEKLLPALVSSRDIKGDLHIHTRWSDGINTIEENIIEAIGLGYEYLAITDHSQALTIAGGLKPEDLVKQNKEIDLLQAKYPQIKILKGIEVDILDDGSLDFTDDILVTLDLVIASIHSNFKMPQEEMTQRIIKALKHPLVKILAHPTGRLLGKRPGYQIDIEQVIDIAASFNKVLEVNASSDRLDLRDIHLQRAKTKGVKIAINTDSHSVKELENIKFGIQTAQRGWQTKDDIINSWSYDKLMQFLEGGK